MARIEWVRLRLNNWGLWKAREQGGALGYATQAAFLGEFSGDRYREAIIPVDEVDASVTDQAVQSLEPAHPELYHLLCSVYVGGSGVAAHARNAGSSRSTINAQLDRADQLLQQWFVARADARKSQRPRNTTQKDSTA